MSKPPKAPKKVNFIEEDDCVDFGFTEGVILRRATLRHNTDDHQAASPSSFQPKYIQKVKLARPRSVRDRLTLNDMQGRPLSIEGLIQAADALKQDLLNGVTDPKI